MCREEIQVDISWGIFLRHSSCLVLSELPGSVLWCLRLIWGDYRSLLLQTFLLFPPLFLSFWSSRYMHGIRSVSFCAFQCWTVLLREILQLRGSFWPCPGYEGAVTAVLPPVRHCWSPARLWFSLELSSLLPLCVCLDAVLSFEPWVFQSHDFEFLRWQLWQPCRTWARF